MRDEGGRKYLFLFLDIIQSQRSKYRLDFYFKPGGQMHNRSLVNIAQPSDTCASVAFCLFLSVFFQRDSLERETLDHDPLAAVFFGHFDGRTPLHSFVLTHTHTPA